MSQWATATGTLKGLRSVVWAVSLAEYVAREEEPIGNCPCHEVKPSFNLDIRTLCRYSLSTWIFSAQQSQGILL
jgi:hypothetical protein